MRYNRPLLNILFSLTLLFAACGDPVLEETFDDQDARELTPDAQGDAGDFDADSRSAPDSGEREDAGTAAPPDISEPDAEDADMDADQEPAEEPNERHYPGAEWEEIDDLEAAGWSQEKLDEAKSISEGLNMASAVLVHKGKIVTKLGDVERKINLHSMRKSLLSALYGPSVDAGIIDLEATMLDMNIDDIPPRLSDLEKSATIRMLLKARSGIYHDSAYTTAGMRAQQPERHSHEPGTFYYYNNWDFNALGTIYNQQTGQDLYQAFKETFADPLQMQFFDPDSDGRYVYDRDVSEHPAYTFHMNSLDLARFGLLMARKGKWKDKRIFSEDWYEESIYPYSDAGANRGYSYMWWVSPAEDEHYRHDPAYPLGAFMATGYRGQRIIVMPNEDAVIVYQNADYNSGESTSAAQISKLVEALLDAKVDGF